MTHRGTVRLETDRLILRRHVEADVPDMFRHWTNDPEVTKYLTWQPHGDIAVTREYMQARLDNYAKEDFYSWALELKATGQVIGNISVVYQQEDIQSVIIGYAMGRAWWNRGYMTEALRAVIKFFFEEVGVNRVEARHDPRNVGSGRVMQKAGMLYEGTLRQAHTNNQGLCDEACYAILAREYKP
jgi:ribosomal-protein-alanine N-acetyltransferase